MELRPVARRVARKELELYFASAAAWLFLAGFAAVCLFVFFWAESFFARNIVPRKGDTAEAVAAIVQISSQTSLGYEGSGSREA